MDLSSLIALNPEVKIKQKNTDRLFYDQYSYGVSFGMLHFWCLRTIVKENLTLSQTLNEVKKRYGRRMRWRQWFAHQSLQIPKDNDIDCDDFINDCTKNLADLAELLFLYKRQVKLIVSGDSGYIYSNDIDLLNSLIKKPYLNTNYIFQANVVRQKNTISLRKSSHRYRTYLNDSRITDSEHRSLSEYLFSQSDWRLSPALQRWCLSSLPWLQRSHFIDHNNATEIVMLELIKSGIIRKTMPIVEVNNSTNYSSGN
jgi:hypothetical protein